MDLYLLKPGEYTVHIDSGSADLKLDQLLAQGVTILMATTDIKAAMARIDAATTAIATKLADLASKVGTGMTDSEVAEVVTGLQAEATKLEGMGKVDEPPAGPAVDLGVGTGRRVLAVVRATAGGRSSDNGCGSAGF